MEQEENNQLASTATSVLFSLKADMGSLQARLTNIVIFTLSLQELISSTKFYGNKSFDSQVGVTKAAAQHRPLKPGGGGETY